MTNKLWIVYDERGVLNPEDAAVLVSCSSLREAWSYRHSWSGAAIYEYDIEGKQLINEMLVGWWTDKETWRV